MYAQLAADARKLVLRAGCIRALPLRVRERSHVVAPLHVHQMQAAGPLEQRERFARSAQARVAEIQCGDSNLRKSPNVGMHGERRDIRVARDARRGLGTEESRELSVTIQAENDEARLAFARRSN